MDREKETATMKKFTAFLILFGALAWGLNASVQGRLSGKVMDAAGAPLEKVAVSIVSQSISGIRFDVTTDSAGKFSQVGLQPGYYMVTFKKEGFMPAAKEVHVEIDTPTALEVKLEKSETAMERAVSESDKLFLKGNKLYQEKNYQDAAAAYEEAIVKSATQWGYYFNLGLAFKKLDQKDKAETAFAKAVELNPESYSANREYGESLAKAQNFEAARKYYQKAAELSPTDPDAFYNLGLCLSKVEGPEAALVAYQKCLELRPDFPEAYYEIGTIAIGQNKKAEAIANLEKFLQLAPGHDKAGLAKQLLDYLKK